MISVQITEFKKSLNVVISACVEVRCLQEFRFFSVVHMHFSFLEVFSSLLVNQIRTSEKLKEIIQRILYLGNIMNQGTARGKLYVILIQHLIVSLIQD